MMESRQVGWYIQEPLFKFINGKKCISCRKQATKVAWHKTRHSNGLINSIYEFFCDDCQAEPEIYLHGMLYKLDYTELIEESEVLGWQ